MTKWTYREVSRVERDETYRIVIAKAGLDGHDRGAKVVARGLRDAGFEVIYTGIRQTPEAIARTAVQEDAHAVGLSSLSGGHMRTFPDVIEQLERMGRADVLVFAGGVIPGEEAEELKRMGVEAVFGPGTEIESIVSFLNERLEARRDRS